MVFQTVSRNRYNMDSSSIIISFCVLTNILLIMYVAITEREHTAEMMKYRSRRADMEIILTKFNNPDSQTDADSDEVEEGDNKTPMNVSNVEYLARDDALHMYLSQIDKRAEDAKEALRDIQSDVEYLKSIIFQTEKGKEHELEEEVQRHMIDMEETMEPPTKESLQQENEKFSDDSIVQPVIFPFRLSFDEDAEVDDFMSEIDDYADFESSSTRVNLRIFQKLANWTEAANECRNENLTLASIHSWGERQEILDAISYSDQSHGSFWVNNQKDTLLNAWSLEDSFYDSEESQGCAFLKPDDSMMEIRGPCDEMKFFICEERL